MCADNFRSLAKAKTLLPFEKKVLLGLKSCGISPDLISERSPVGLAVSGGADSVSMLLSLCAVFPPESLRVITVDHGIRSESESGGDADFVRRLCDEYMVLCVVERIVAGEIEARAKESALSVEALARERRYAVFDAFIKKENLSALCLAHNQNDQTETLLMRFLQGSAGEGMAGIKRRRGKIVRPLLDIPRSEIEDYLCEKKQEWRTDSTNTDTSYLRNKVRHLLVPVLDEYFSGWQTAVLSGAKKASSDEDGMRLWAESSLYGKSQTEEKYFRVNPNNPNESEVCIRRVFFYALHDALKRRVFFTALNDAGFGGRFPFHLFEEIASWKDKEIRKLCFESVRVSLDADALRISVSDTASEKENFIESGFSFLFKKIGDKAEYGNLLIHTEDSGLEKRVNLVLEQKIAGRGGHGEKIVFQVAVPFLLRSVMPGDMLRTASGSQKNVSAVLSDWKIPPELRGMALAVEELVPASQNAGNLLKALLALHIGFKNWIVE